MYTTKEKKLINKTWSWLMYQAAITSNEYKLEQQLKYERKERSSVGVAKCLIIESALTFYIKHNGLDPRADLMDLSRTSQGILLGGLIGFQGMERTKAENPKAIEKLKEHMQKVCDIHAEAISRRLNSL